MERKQSLCYSGIYPGVTRIVSLETKTNFGCFYENQLDIILQSALPGY